MSLAVSCPRQEKMTLDEVPPTLEDNCKEKGLSRSSQLSAFCSTSSALTDKIKIVATEMNHLKNFSVENANTL